ncbi:MAG: hypothetical protein AB1798_20185, partial [Spirochaetota bacterium]
LLYMIQYDYRLTLNNYITSFVIQYPAESNPEWEDNPPPLPEMQGVGALFDQYGKPKYQLIDKKIVYNPQMLTTEEKERERKKYVVAKIRELYSVDEEIKLINRGIMDSRDQDYIIYREKVEAIKLTTKILEG